MNITSNQPEKLGLWDILFNRYRKVIHQRGSEAWVKQYSGQVIPNSKFQRDWVEYKIIDRVTGSETIERKYLN